MLQVKQLSVEAENKILLKNINLSISEGETHILMGPNGAGKSTLCKAIMSHPSLKKTSGTCFFDQTDITKSLTDEIAKLGIYYIAQSPMEIEGVTNAELLRTALQEHQQNMNIFTFNKECNKICEKLNIPKSFLHRDVNVAMSGGEKKKNELMGVWLLKPKLIILDEIDSGLDVDAIKIVAKNLQEYQHTTNCSILIVTHQPTLLQILKPDYAHLMVDQTIKQTGDYKLVEDILKNGFQKYIGSNVITQHENEE